MTCSDLTREISELGVRNGRFDMDYRGWINRAQKTIASRRNWTFMHNRGQFTIPSGSTSVSLGSTFKQLSSEQSPVSYTYGIYNLPVYVASREEIEGRGIWPWTNGPTFQPTPGGAWPIRVVFIEQNSGGNWTINIPPQFAPQLDLTFNVSAYFYPADLALGTDHNALTDNGFLGDALLNLVKSIAYSSEDSTDKRVMGCRALYEDYFNQAAYEDAARQYSGRTLRM